MSVRDDFLPVLGQLYMFGRVAIGITLVPGPAVP